MNRIGLLRQWSLNVREILNQSLTVVKVFCFLQVTNTHLATLAFTYGPSMLPTLNLTGDLMLVERISPRMGKVQRGDIVLVRSPVLPTRVVTKRLIGLEGDQISYLVNPHEIDSANQTVVVPKGHIWVEGDNIYNSKDSRQFGAVPYALLEGKVCWRIWPPKDFGPLERKDRVSH